MRQRIITGAIFGAVMLLGIFGGEVTALLLLTVILGGCLYEFYNITLPGTTTGDQWRKYLAIGLGVGIFGFQIFLNSSMSGGDYLIRQMDPWAANRLILILVLPLGLIFELFQKSDKPFSNFGHVVAGLAYLVFPFCLLLDFLQPYHAMLLFSLFLLIWVNDSMAYFTGSKLGKHKLFERISPKKTWEGTFGGLLFTLLFAYALAQYLPEFSVAKWLAFGAAASIFGTLGDLVESMWKRSYGIKDSGSFMPGHGGFLDRFDAFVFMIPFLWVIHQIYWL